MNPNNNNNILMDMDILALILYLFFYVSIPIICTRDSRLAYLLFVKKTTSIFGIITKIIILKYQWMINNEPLELLTILVALLFLWRKMRVMKVRKKVSPILRFVFLFSFRTLFYCSRKAVNHWPETQLIDQLNFSKDSIPLFASTFWDSCPMNIR